MWVKNWMTKTLNSKWLRNFCDEKTFDWVRRNDFEKNFSMMKSLMMICNHLIDDFSKFDNYWYEIKIKLSWWCSLILLSVARSTDIYVWYQICHYLCNQDLLYILFSRSDKVFFLFIDRCFVKNAYFVKDV